MFRSALLHRVMGRFRPASALPGRRWGARWEQAPKSRPKNRSLVFETLEERLCLDAALVYFDFAVGTFALINVGGETVANDNDNDDSGKASAADPLPPSYTLSASSSVSFTGASASAQSSASISVGNLSASGTAAVQASKSASASAGSGLAGGVFVGAELGSTYDITQDVSDGQCFVPGGGSPIPTTVQGTIPTSGFVPDDTSEDFTPTSWLFVELPGEATPPKLAFWVDSFVAGSNIGVGAGGGGFSLPYSCSVSATAEHTPLPPGDIVAISAERSCPDGSCFSLTYRIDENPVPPFRLGLYASNDAQ